MQATLKGHIAVIAKGFGMGAADVIPGVSGGTMALIFGIYTRLINAIKSFDGDWLRGILTLDPKVILHRPHFPFLIPLFLGICSAVLFFTHVIPIPVLIHTHPETIYGLFFGLIMGSILILLGETGRFTFKNLQFIVAGAAFGYLIFSMVPIETPETSWFIFFSGAVAVSAMILPGISGSFILLMLKKYAYIFNAIGNFNFAVIIPFIGGMLTGLFLCSRVLSWLLKTWYRETLGTLIGLLVASLWIIWPFQKRLFETIRGKERLLESVPYMPQQINANVSIAIAMIIAGLLLVLILNHYATGKSITHRKRK